jgi:hypothetical protein
MTVVSDHEQYPRRITPFGFARAICRLTTGLQGAGLSEIDLVEGCIGD